MTHAPEQTQALGQALGRLLGAGDVVLLSGDLGVGKTTFCKGVGRGLGVQDEMTSPTFTLIAEYEGRVPLAHMDLYRLAGNARRLDEMGWDDYVESDYAVLVEWPLESMQGLDDALHVRIEKPSFLRFHERTFVCRAVGAKSAPLLQEWMQTWQSL